MTDKLTKENTSEIDIFLDNVGEEVLNYLSDEEKQVIKDIAEENANKLSEAKTGKLLPKGDTNGK